MKTSISRALSSIVLAASVAGIPACGAPDWEDDDDWQDSPGDEFGTTEQAAVACSEPVLPNAFRFNCGPQGFRRQGAYDGDTYDNISYVSKKVADWFGGNLIFGSLPLSQAEPVSPFLRIDHISPSLRDLPGWQGQRTYSARVAHSGFLGEKWAQMVVEGFTAEGTHLLFPSRDATGHAIFCPVTLTSSSCGGLFSLPAGFTVTNVQVRLFVTPEGIDSAHFYISEVTAGGI